ncbi:JmjC domain-containing protein 7 [Podospora australis]|uniref:JmjC domain-containing protein 7 n=1 Tax=Podospora australis TaxID=1536484 RepID=A0AAN7AN68_9PEZI|nr:JmjC domain-containing protein 7 [Podospora australis]
MEDTDNQDPIAELIENYHELNSSAVHELHEEPSPLEFMRYVAKNTPFVVRGAAANWQATRTWNVGFLKEVLGEETVNVAVTPAGNADAPTLHTTPDGTSSLVFAKPHEEDQAFPTFIDYLTTQSLSSSEREIRYAQTQNDNLRNEYLPLFSHVPPSIPFARIALDKQPDAINLWIGNDRSVTALHKDNYENIYVQIAGKKHFVLLPPICHPCINEQHLQPAHYVRSSSSSSLDLVVETEEPKVPFATWDPDQPFLNETEYSCLAEPMRVTLEPGDMLYLPCMWYHKVSQSCSPEGMCVAVNYWYDMDFAGPLFPLTTFVKSVYKKEKEKEDDAAEDENPEGDGNGYANDNHDDDSDRETRRAAIFERIAQLRAEREEALHKLAAEKEERHT